MSTLTENTLVQSIKIIPATGVIEVERVTQVLRDGEVIASSAPVLQVLEPHADLTGLEPAVAAVAAATWTPEQLADATAKMLAHIQERQEEQERRLAGVNRSLSALASAHKELDAQHATLAERSEQVTRARSDLFDRHEQIRAQHPQLDAVLKGLAAKIPAA